VIDDNDMAVVGILEDESAREQAEIERQKAIHQEKKDVKAWGDKIKAGRALDAAARKQYAVDRGHCSVDAGKAYGVSVPIAAAYVDVLSSYLFARDPAMDSQPSAAAGPARMEDARSLAKTINIVLSGLWREGGLKAGARPFTRSALTIGVGWMKAVYLHRTENDPLVQKQVADLQDNLARIQAYQEELAKGETDSADDRETIKAALEAQIQGLQQNVEVVKAQGMVFDFVPGEDIQLAPECPSAEMFLDSPWIAHRVPIAKKDAKVELPLLSEEQLNKADVYTKRRPADADGEQRTLEAYKAEDADAYVSTKGVGECEEYVFAWEIWDKTANVLRVWVEGTERWARPVEAPQVKTRRFYPFFTWQPLQVDGKRHPESLPHRSAGLLDDYNEARTDWRTFRRRSLPVIGFDRGNLDPGDIDAIVDAEGGERVGIDAKGQDLSRVLVRLTTPEFNPALYDTAAIRAELELVWGIQEALSSSIQTAKTATEADIQQTGTESRLSFYRDSLDEMFIELAKYSAEVALMCLPLEEAQRFAGPEAYWPAGITIEQLDILLSIDIRAGSTTKAASGLRQERWTQIAPLIRESIDLIGQLRNSSPLEIADKHEELLKETLDRFGENMDAARFIPTPGEPMQLIDPTTMQPVLAYPAPQQPGAPPAAALPPPAAPNPDEVIP
jgi:vacuolar-type H+-ATPase subunit H